MANEAKLYMVTLQVGDVPKEFYQEHGPRDIAYTRALIDAGTVVEMFVSMNRRQIWLAIRAADEVALKQITDGFPMSPYLTVEQREVMNLGAQVRSGQVGPPRG